MFAIYYLTFNNSFEYCTKICYHCLCMENNIKIATVCGLCAGCTYAINQTQNALDKGKNVTLFKEIVHNKNVNNMLKAQGVNFCDRLEDLPKDHTIILRAHGEPESTITNLSSNGYSFVDCTCINVKKIHEQVLSHSTNGKIIIIIGKYGKHNGVIHPEIEGTIGWSKTEPVLIEDADDIKKLEGFSNTSFYLVCQTTFNMEKADALITEIENTLSKNNNQIEINKSICLAQKQINLSSQKLAKESDLMIVVGGKNSSNTTELYNGLKTITKTIFVEDINLVFDELAQNNITLSKDLKIGLTAGASTLRSELETLKEILTTKLKELENV